MLLMAIGDGEPVLQLVDMVLAELALGGTMYVGRRAEDGDYRTFVIQTGEEGRHRMRLPDLSSPRSIVGFMAEAQAHVAEALGTPVPLCPLHDHALDGTADRGDVAWVCREGAWRCAVGDYEELSWPQGDDMRMTPILCARLDRRGITRVRTIAVRRTENGLVAEFGVPEMSLELINALREAAAPLPVSVYEDSRPLIRARAVPD
jgi:hypothetical protein